MNDCARVRYASSCDFSRLLNIRRRSAPPCCSPTPDPNAAEPPLADRARCRRRPASCRSWRAGPSSTASPPHSPHPSQGQVARRPARSLPSLIRRSRGVGLQCRRNRASGGAPGGPRPCRSRSGARRCWRRAERRGARPTAVQLSEVSRPMELAANGTFRRPDWAGVHGVEDRHDFGDPAGAEP